MRTPRLCSTLLWACLALPLPLLAEVATLAPHHTDQAPTLRTAVEGAWRRSPLVQTQDARLDESAAARELAGSWIAASPTLGMSQRSDRWNDGRGERETEVSLAATIWMPGQKSAREAHAISSSTEASALAAQARLSIAGQVRISLWEAALAHELLSERRDHVKHLEELAADVQRRVDAGELARSDGLLATQELLAARNDVSLAEIQFGEARARFRVLTGYAELPKLDPEPLPSETRSNIRLQAAQASLQRAKAGLELATASRNPPPTIAVLARQDRVANVGESYRSVGIALQVPLGSRKRNRPAETLAATQFANASAEAAQAEADVAAQQDLARQQLAISTESLEVATRRAEAMREHTRLIDTAFREGERGLVELLRSRALSHEADIAVRQQRVRLGQAHSRLNQALGILP